MAKQLSWDDLFLQGSIINLTSSRWTARLTMTPADLGIEPSAEVTKALALGAHRLAPLEAFKDITAAHSKAVKIVQQNTLCFPLVHGARYAPTSKVEAILRLLREARAEHDAAVDAFVDSYQTIKDQMLDVLSVALREAAKTDAAADAAMERIRRAYPTSTEVKAAFSLSWSVYAVTGARSAGTTEAIESETSSVRSTIAAMVREMREETTAKIAAVQKCIANGGALTQRTIDSAIAALDRVDAINVLGDDKLTVQTAALRALLRTVQAGEDVKPEEVKALDAIKAAIQADTAAAIEAAEAKIGGVQKRRGLRVA